LNSDKTVVELGRRMMGATIWVGASQLFGQSLQFLALLILVRAMEPEDFGVFAMAFIVVGVATIFVEMGLPSALIQARDLTRDQANSASWVCFGLAVVFAAVVVTTAPLAASVFGEPRVTPLLRILSAGFILNSLSVVPDSVLRRDLRFREVGAGDVGRSIFYFCASVPAALLGWGPWSFVAGELSGSAARFIILTALSGQKPFGRFNLLALKPLLSFGAKNAASSLFHALRLQTDMYFVGVGLGAGVLGGYNIIKKVITTPQQRVSWLLIKVCFPGFSRIQDDDERLRRVYVKIVSVTAFITWPALAFVIANTAPVVDVFLGPQWSFIVAPLRLMCIAGCSISVVALTGSVVLAKGLAALDLKLSVFAMAFLALTMFASVRYGLVGVSIGFLIYTVISNSISQYYANKVLALSFKSLIRALFPGAITAVAVATAVHIAGGIVYGLYGNYASVGAAVAAAAIIFTVFAYVLRRRDIIVVKDYVSAKIKPCFSGRSADVYRGLVS